MALLHSGNRITDAQGVKKEAGIKQESDEEGVVKTERMNKRNRRRNRSEGECNTRKKELCVCMCVCVPLSFILRCSKTNAALLRQHYYYTHAHTHSYILLGDKLCATLL